MMASLPSTISLFFRFFCLKSYTLDLWDIFNLVRSNGKNSNCADLLYCYLNWLELAVSDCEWSSRLGGFTESQWWQISCIYSTVKWTRWTVAPCEWTHEERYQGTAHTHLPGLFKTRKWQQSHRKPWSNLIPYNLPVLVALVEWLDSSQEWQGCLT